MDNFKNIPEIDRPIVDNGKMFIWMQLLGLDRNQPDYGVGEFKKRMNCTPDGVCLFLCHPDIIHDHTDMETEFELHPDDCSYCAIPQNTVHERQPWTKYDLRGAVKELKKAGIPAYLSVQGASYNNTFHREWITDHPELHQYSRADGKKCLMVLKRFKDGTYYEDFLVEKLSKLLVDYDFDGFQMSDCFCPAGILHDSDFSTEFIEQFLDYSGITLPEEIAKTMGDDDDKMVGFRGEWIWKNVREQWILFHVWRWDRFLKKVCDAVHALNKKVIALAVYCTDPFETLYSIGIDLQHLFKAGVDYIMPNTLPTSVYMSGFCDKFWRYMSTASLNAAFINGNEQLCMLGVKDSTEEWDMLQHVPCLFQRDMYTLLGQQHVTADGCKRAADGTMICLGDSIEADEWAFIKKHFRVAYTSDVLSVETPVIVWSDKAMYNSLPEIIKTGRWSVHKFMYEAGIHGAPLGGTVRIENIKASKGTLFVPNFDFLPEDERKAVADYKNGPLVLTFAEGFDMTPYGLECDMSFTDKNSKFPMTIFASGTTLSADMMSKIRECLSLPDIEPEPEYSIDETPDWFWHVPGTIPFIKHTTGFIKAYSMLLAHANDKNMALTSICPTFNDHIELDCPNITLKLNNGKYRIYLYNPEREIYRRARVDSKVGIKEAKVVSFYPQLPVKYGNTTDEVDYRYKYDDETIGKLYGNFTTKIHPNGITVVDVELAE